MSKGRKASTIRSASRHTIMLMYLEQWFSKEKSFLKGDHSEFHMEREESKAAFLKQGGLPGVIALAQWATHGSSGDTWEERKAWQETM